MPHVLGSEEPNFVIYKSEQPKLFETIRTHFDDMWEHGRTYVETPLSLAPIPQRDTPSTAPVTASYMEENPFSVHFVVQALNSKFWWLENGEGEPRHILPDGTIPKGAKLSLQVWVRIEAPSLLVEDVRLVIMAQSLPSDWTSMQLDRPREQYVYFEIPPSITPGKHRARIVAKSHGAERRSTLFEVDVPQVKQPG